MVVMKFGGTSVADRTAIERLIAIVADERRRARPGTKGPIVVVSALAGVTDRLLEVAALAGEGRVDEASARVRDVHQRHVVVAEVVTNDALRAGLLDTLTQEFAELERVVSALGVLRGVSPRWLDAVAAVGELASSRLVAAALTAHGLPAAWVDARSILVTDSEHQAAAPRFAETTAALQAHVAPVLDALRIPVVGGFVGATTDGVTTTLGRGGSDYSAAIIGACLGVDEIQIWTDVDGMLTSDPRIVNDPHVVPHITFAEAAELAYFGAKVLHPATIQPAVSRNIPVRILNSRRAEAPGTLITAERPPGERPLTAVAAKKGVTVVDITSTRMLMAHGFLSRLFAVFERHRTPVDVVTTSEVSVSVTVDDTRHLASIVAELAEFAEVSRESSMAIVCAVGDGLQQQPAMAAEVLASIGDVPLRMVSQAAGRRNVTFVIREGDVATALGRVHRAFFSTAPMPAPVTLTLS